MLTTMLCDEIPASTGFLMQLSVRTVADLGLALRATRRSGKVRLDDLAQIAGVSKQFVSDVEYGKQTVQLGLVLKLLLEMGVFMSDGVYAFTNNVAGQCKISQNLYGATRPSSATFFSS